MGQQQLLLIILGVIIVGIAVAVGISMFTTQSDEATKDQVVQDLNNLCTASYQFRIKPLSLGGGGNSFVGYNPSTKLLNNTNIGGVYAINALAVGTASFKVTAPPTGTVIAASVDSTGKIIVTGR